MVVTLIDSARISIAIHNFQKETGLPSFLLISAGTFTGSKIGHSFGRPCPDVRIVTQQRILRFAVDLPEVADLDVVLDSIRLAVVQA